MAVGNVNSQERGSGARFNDGKPPLALIPVRIMLESYIESASDVGNNDARNDALLALAEWQEGGGVECLHRSLRLVALSENVKLSRLWDECAYVFGFGQSKYAPWNWAKGMPWSVPFECALRHFRELLDRQLIDSESGFLHRGHFACNIAMLIHYARTYPEGDDRPDQLLPKEKPLWVSLAPRYPGRMQNTKTGEVILWPPPHHYDPVAAEWQDSTGKPANPVCQSSGD